MIEFVVFWSSGGMFDVSVESIRSVCTFVEAIAVEVVIYWLFKSVEEIDTISVVCMVKLVVRYGV